MIKYTPQSQISNTLFKSPFQSDLNQNNRWVLLEKMLPWDEMVTPLKKRMDSKRGRGSIDLRYILGALFIKGLENLSDEDTIRAIQENIYMQYFVGLREFITEPLFVPEVFVEVRKRLGEEGMMEINEKLLKYAHKTGMIHHRKEYRKQNQGGDKGSKNKKLKADSNNPEENQKQSDSSGDSPNRGTLKLDATVADQDVTYPVDTQLLNRARRETESIIDRMYKLGIWGDKKPRTYRRNARNDYMNFSKKRRPGAKTIRKCNKQQLQYIARNLRYIDQGWDMMTEDQVMKVFKEPNSYRNQLVVREVYRQQKELLHKRGKKNEPNSIPDRIVSFHEPWVRPIVRGKSGRKTEFGAKVNFSETEGFIRADRVDFNNFNEAKDLKNQIEAFKRLYGHYPAHVLVDKIYLNRENRKYLDSKGINHYGPQLGRPAQLTKEQKRKRKKRQNKRSEIEGKFGLGKFKFGMNKIQMRRSDTSKAQINLIAISMNIWQMLLNIFALKPIFSHKLWYRSKAILNLKGMLDNFLKLIVVSTGRIQKNRLLAD
jgi:transposase, IS5 family